MRPLRLNIIPSFLSLVAVPSLLLWGKLRCFCCCCCVSCTAQSNHALRSLGTRRRRCRRRHRLASLLSTAPLLYYNTQALSLSLSLLSFPLSSRAHSSRVRVRPRSNEYIKTLVYKAHITIALSSPFCLAGIQLNTEILYIQKEREREEKKSVCLVSPILFGYLWAYRHNLFSPM